MDVSMVAQVGQDVMLAAHNAVASVPLEVPNPGDGTAPPGFAKFTSIMSWSKWVSLGVLVVALIIQGASMGFQSRRGQGGEHAGALGWIMGGVMLVWAAWSIVGFLV